jgi:hypothetical protein
MRLLAMLVASGCCWALAAAAAATATASEQGVAGDFDAPVYTLDLDLPPEERWKESLLGQIQQHGWEYSFKPALDYIDTVVPPSLWADHEMELRAIAEPIIGAEAASELKGIQTLAGSIGHNVSLAGEGRTMRARCAARVANQSPHARAAHVPVCRA